VLRECPLFAIPAVLFIISAVESVDDAVLGFSGQKAHARRFLRVIKTFRELA